MIRKKFLYLAIITTILCFTNASMFLGSMPPRHVDPGSLDRKPVDPKNLFMLYEYVIDDAVNECYDVARDDLGLAKRVQVEEGVRLTLNGFDGLLLQEFSLFNSTYNDLSAARDLVFEGRREALTPILEALPILDEAETKLDGVDSKIRLMGDKFEVDPTILLDATARLRALAEQYRLELLDLKQQVDDLYFGLAPTSITIDVNPLRGIMGNVAEVNGTLRDDRGQGMPYRYVELYVNHHRYFPAKTDRSGRFTVSFTLYFAFSDSELVEVEYWPQKGDAEIYQPATSNAVRVDWIYVTPELRLSVPEEAYAGKPLRINGTLEASGKPVTGVLVYFLALGQGDYMKTGQDGEFEFILEVDEAWVDIHAPINVYTISKGEYNEVSITTSVHVTQMPVIVELDSLVGFVGQPFLVSGRVSSGGKPIKNCSVELVLGLESLVVKTSETGAFSANFTVQGSASTEHSLTVEVKPVEVWYRPTTFYFKLYFIDLLLFTLAITILVGATLYSWRIYSGKLGSAFSSAEETPKPNLPNMGDTPRRFGRTKIKFVLIVAVICTTVYVAGTVPWITEINGIAAATRHWDELTDLYTEIKPTRIQNLSELSGLMLDPGNVTLLMIGPSEHYTAEDAAVIRNHIESGGRVVLADDFGTGNELLELLGIDARFDGRVPKNPLFYFKEEAMPIVSVRDFPEYPERYFMVMNYPTVITKPWGGAAFPEIFTYYDEGTSGLGGEVVFITEIIIPDKGSIYLVSDPSIFINSMLSEGDNRQILRALVFGPVRFWAAPPPCIAVIDESHSLPIGFADINRVYEPYFQMMDSAEAKILLSSLLVLVAFLLMGRVRPRRTGADSSKLATIPVSII